MRVTRKSLFEGETLKIGLFEARPTSDACGDVEWQKSNVVVLPFSGVFSKHDAPGRHVIGTPSYAVFIASDTPYRISFPGAIGDRALIVRFRETLAPELLGRRGSESLASHGLLPSNAIMLRNLLWTRLEKGEADRFETEALGLDLLNMSLRSMRAGDFSLRRSTLVRQMDAVKRVKEAVALAPAHKWSVAQLARIAICRRFICAASPDCWYVHLRLRFTRAPRVRAGCRS